MRRGDAPLTVPTVAQLLGYMPLEAFQREQASSRLKQSQQVSLFSIMAKDKGNLLCFKICNKQPLMMNEAAIKFKTERAVMLLLN